MILDLDKLLHHGNPLKLQKAKLWRPAKHSCLWNPTLLLWSFFGVNHDPLPTQDRKVKPPKLDSYTPSYQVWGYARGKRLLTAPSTHVQLELSCAKNCQAFSIFSVFGVSLKFTWLQTVITCLKHKSNLRRFILIRETASPCELLSSCSSSALAYHALCFLFAETVGFCMDSMLPT